MYCIVTGSLKVENVSLQKQGSVIHELSLCFYKTSAFNGVLVSHGACVTSRSVALMCQYFYFPTTISSFSIV